MQPISSQLTGRRTSYYRAVPLPRHTPCTIRPRRRPVEPCFSRQPSSAVEHDLYADEDALDAVDSPLEQLMAAMDPQEPEEVETLYQLPEDVAMHLNHLVTMVCHAWHA